MKKILIILSFFVSYSAYAQYVPKAGNKLNVKPNGILVPTSSADDTPIARLEVFASGVSTIKPTALPIASASLLGAFRVGTGLSIDGSGILSTVGGSAPDTTIYRTVANSRSLAQTQTALNAKQNTLVSGTNIKTINGASVLGSGDLIVTGSSQTLDQVLTTGNTSTQNATVGGLSASNRIAVGGALDVNYVSKFISTTSDNYNAFTSTSGTGEYGIYDNALYFQALTLSNGIRFYGNNTAPNAGLSVNASNNVVIQSSLNLSPLTASTLLKLDASKNVVNAVSNTDFLPVASPTMTGTPVAPTPGSNINTTQIPTTAWTNTYYATKASPTFTGTPAAPTATAKTSTTQIATTAFVGKQFTATGSGTGAATTISFAHGVSGVTSVNSVIVTPNNAAAAGLIYVTLDATNVNVVYSVAPASGTNNLAYSVSIK